MLLLKDFHYHNTSYHGSDKASVSHNASLKQVCSTCDFTMHESVEAKATVFQPVVAISLGPKTYIYRTNCLSAVVSINSHFASDSGLIITLFIWDRCALRCAYMSVRQTFRRFFAHLRGRKSRLLTFNI